MICLRLACTFFLTLVIIYAPPLSGQGAVFGKRQDSLPGVIQLNAPIAPGSFAPEVPTNLAPPRTLNSAEANNSIELVIRQQLDDLRELDFSKAYYAYMATDFQKAFDLNVFKAFVRKNPTLFRNKDFTVDSSSFMISLLLSRES